MTAALYLLCALVVLLAIGVVMLGIYALGRLSSADAATLAAKSEASTKRLACAVATNQRDSARAQLATATDKVSALTVALDTSEKQVKRLQDALAAKETPAEAFAEMGKA